MYSGSVSCVPAIGSVWSRKRTSCEYHSYFAGGEARYVQACTGRRKSTLHREVTANGLIVTGQLSREQDECVRDIFVNRRSVVSHQSMLRPTTTRLRCPIHWSCVDTNLPVLALLKIL